MLHAPYYWLTYQYSTGTGDSQSFLAPPNVSVRYKMRGSMRFLTKGKVGFGPTLVLTRHPLQVPVLGRTGRGPHILNQHEDWDGQFRLPPGFEYCTVGLVKRMCQSTRGLIF